jgi:hypothetical protein
MFMQSSPDSTQPVSILPLRSFLLIIGMIAAGFSLTLYVFYPGVMTYDSRYVYDDIAKGTFGDWQSPVMTLLWSLIDPIAPGSASMFLLTATLYWLAFALLAFTIGRISIWLAVALLLLAVSPPAFTYVGIIWRDVLFAIAWLLASTLAYSAAGRHVRLRVPIFAVALTLLVFGVLLRPNALLAAPLLGTYILWPTQFLWKRAILLYAPQGLALFALLQFVYYGILNATPQHSLQSFMVFDLGGISHFSKENQFPGIWTDQETALITTGCYQPTEWDIYWLHEPCLFVMKQLESEKIFGTPAIVDAWLRAVAIHPVAYLQHRSAFMWNFIVRPNLTMWTVDISDPSKSALTNRPGLAAVQAIDAMLKPTPLSRVGTWLFACVTVFAFAWSRRRTPLGAFAIAICASAIMYMLTFFIVGVASDFRYGYMAVLMAIAGGITIAAPICRDLASSVLKKRPPRAKRCRQLYR